MVGTKTEMERLLKHATEISGVEYDISSLNDIFQAIHVIQEELGITGTTAIEAEGTISGSVNAMKASWDNFLNGSGTFDQFVESAKIAFNNILKASKKIIPRIMQEVINALPKQLVKTIKTLLPVLIALGTALGVIWGYFKAVAIIKAVQTAFATLNAVMAANPIVLIVAAIAGLVAAFIYLWNNCEAFRNFWVELWNSIQQIVVMAVEWIKNTWQNFVLFIENIVKPIENFFTELWDTVKTGAETAWNKVKEIWNVVADWFSDTIINPINNFFDNMWNRLKNGASNAWAGIKNAFSHVTSWFRDTFTEAWTNVKNVFSTGGKIFTGITEGITATFKKVVQAIINGINKVIKKPFDSINGVIRKIKGVSIMGAKPFDGLSTIQIPQIPSIMEWGGILKRGQVGLLEGKGDEAVVPLHQNRKWIKAVAEEMQRAIVMENGAINANASIKSNNNLNNVINARFAVDGSLVVDGQRLGRIVAPYTMQTIRAGGGR